MVPDGSRISRQPGFGGVAGAGGARGLKAADLIAMKEI
jgi:hypothetical protein